MTAVDLVLALSLPALVVAAIFALVIKDEIDTRRRCRIRELGCTYGDGQPCQKCTQGYPLVWTTTETNRKGSGHIHLCINCYNRRLDIMAMEKELLDRESK